MKTSIRFYWGRRVGERAFVFFALASLITIALSAAAAYASDTLIYSLETGIAANPDGFHANGGGVTVSQDTIGATDGTHSMKISIVAGATFVGALEEASLPLAIGNPPGADHILFDMTIASPADVFPGAFANIGVTIFGASQPDFPGGQLFGLQAQMADFEHIDGKAAGTYKDIRIDLTNATNQVDFSTNQTFNQIFGSGPNQQIPTGFELYINKSGEAPLNVYIDNIRIGTTPAANTGDYNGNGIVDAADYTIWRDTLGSTTDLRANGDNAGASAGKIDQADYTLWKSKFGTTSGSGALSLGAVPEPSSAALLWIAAICCWGARRGRAAR
jgi:hypothetical protein